MKPVLLLAFAILPFVLKGQHVELKGRVHDSQGVPLALASVAIMPDSLFTATNDDGHFVLRVNSGKKRHPRQLYWLR